MLAEERLSIIQNAVEQQGSITLQELTKLTGASESTVRRDLAHLHNLGRVKKVFGGATSAHDYYTTQDPDIEVRKKQNAEQKTRIAQRAAALLEPGDFVFLDAGSTIEQMALFIDCPDITVVTNAIVPARILCRAGIETHILGGELKAVTEAVVGTNAINSLRHYNFTKGFFGTNGIDVQRGFTTPEISEAMVKQEAFGRCAERYMLADPSKLGVVTPITFADFNEATILTTTLPNDSWRAYSNIQEVDPA